MSWRGRVDEFGAHDKQVVASRGQLRAGASDLEIAERWAAARGLKKAGHDIDDPTFSQPGRTMSAIGG